MRKHNIFVLGLNAFNRHKLERLPRASEYRFHGVLDPEEVLEAEHFPIAELLRRAGERIAACPEAAEAVIGYVDFPVSTMLPILAQRFGLRSASLESLLKCEHKYWSRVVQREVVAEHIPRFEAFDPFDDQSIEEISLEFPFWIKPVKSAGSFLGFRVHDRQQLHEAVAMIREKISVFSEPFNHILGYLELPPQIAGIDANHCLAESLIGGHQCTLEGYVLAGDVHIHGIVDSIRARNRSSFLRYQYPSRLPQRVTRDMTSITQRLLTHIGFDDCAFNIEFFWDRNAQRVWLLEVNPRIAQHHSELFEKVDGVSNHEVVVEVALGRRPRLPHGAGTFRYAACCFLRRYRDGVVTRAPSAAEIAALEREIPGLVIELHVKPGTRLSELTHQDSYSYVLALAYVGAEDPQALRETWRYCRRKLRFEVRE